MRLYPAGVKLRYETFVSKSELAPKKIAVETCIRICLSEHTAYIVKTD
jgi:hypothetical protein